MKNKVIAFALAVCMTFGSAALLPEGAFESEASITAAAESENVIETKLFTFKELADGTLELTKYKGEGGAVSIPSKVKDRSVTRIGEWAFGNSQYRYKVTSVKLPESVKSIGGHAFYMCSHLEEINLPKKLEEICEYAFSFSGLMKAELTDTLTRLGDHAFDSSDLTSINIPGSVKSIGASCFRSCRSLETVVINKGTMRICASAFNGCIKLTKISLPDTLLTIGGYAFSNCEALKNISIPNSVTTMGNTVFFYCKEMESITIPNSVTAFGKGMFDDCIKLKNVVLPSGLDALPDETFTGCKVLESVDLPKNIKSIGGDAFRHCASLKKLTIPSGVQTIGSSAFYQCTALRQITIPVSVKELKTGAFSCCSSLKSITIPKGVKSLGSEVFSCCPVLSQVKLSDGLESIGENAFYDCVKLKSITVPKSVKNIGEMAIGYIIDRERNYPEKDDSLTVRCYKNSAAEKYALENKLKYTLIAPAQTRLAGSSRYGTASQIAKAAYGKADTVILAYGLNYADALAGVPLAEKLKAPILLTSKDSVPKETTDAIKTLGAKNVIILGGVGVINDKVEKALKAQGLKTRRIAGRTRFETAAKIALEVDPNPADVFFVYAFNSADALSVSTVAARRNAPIIYLSTNGELNADTAAYLAKLKKKGGSRNVYFIGGKGVISDTMAAKALTALGVATGKRIAGNNRYETCIAVNNKFRSVLTGDGICVAKGLDFPDALAGGVYAAKYRMPLFLADGKKLLDCQNTYLKGKSAAKITVFGGKGAVPDELIKLIVKASM